MTQPEFKSYNDWILWLKANYPQSGEIISFMLTSYPPVHVYNAIVDGVNVSEYRERQKLNNSW